MTTFLTNLSQKRSKVSPALSECPMELEIMVMIIFWARNCLLARLCELRIEKFFSPLAKIVFWNLTSRQIFRNISEIVELIVSLSVVKTWSCMARLEGHTNFDLWLQLRIVTTILDKNTRDHNLGSTLLKSQIHQIFSQDCYEIWCKTNHDWHWTNRGNELMMVLAKPYESLDLIFLGFEVLFNWRSIWNLR